MTGDRIYITRPSVARSLLGEGRTDCKAYALPVALLRQRGVARQRRNAPPFKLIALQYGAKAHESLFVRVTARSTVARAYFVARFVLHFFRLLFQQ